MKRYYQVKLNYFQLTLKIIIASAIIIGIYFILMAYVEYDFFKATINRYVLMPSLILMTVIFYNINKNHAVRSFFFKENQIVICNYKEHTIPLKEVELLELLTDLNSIFGYKTVIIYHNKKRYPILLPKHKAQVLIKWLENKINNYQEPFIDDLKF